MKQRAPSNDVRWHNISFTNTSSNHQHNTSTRKHVLRGVTVQVRMESHGCRRSSEACSEARLRKFSGSTPRVLILESCTHISPPRLHLAASLQHSHRTSPSLAPSPPLDQSLPHPPLLFRLHELMLDVLPLPLQHTTVSFTSPHTISPSVPILGVGDTYTLVDLIPNPIRGRLESPVPLVSSRPPLHSRLSSASDHAGVLTAP